MADSDQGERAGGAKEAPSRSATGLLPASFVVQLEKDVLRMYYTLSAVGLILILLFLAWHFRSRYVDHLPSSLSSRLRYYAPLQTFEDAAENGQSLPL